MTKLSDGLPYRLLRRWDAFWRNIPLSVRYEIWSDASSKGYGGHLGPQSQPVDVWHKTHAGLGKSGNIERVEAEAVLLSLKRWADHLRGKKVYCYVDNYQVFHFLNQTYRSPLPIKMQMGSIVKMSKGKCRVAQTIKIFRDIDHVIKTNNIDLRARWVSGTHNTLADRLSRLSQGQANLSPQVKALLEAGTAVAAGVSVDHQMESTPSAVG